MPRKTKKGAVNRNQYWRMRNLKWNHGTRQENGYIPTYYNYNSSQLQKDFIGLIYLSFKEMGFNKSQGDRIISNLAKVNPMEWRYIVTGRKPIELWMIEPLCEITGMRVRFHKAPAQNTQRSYTSEGSRWQLLTLKSKRPNFTVTFDKGDTRIFSANFAKDNYIINAVKEKIPPFDIYFKFVWELVHWFYVDVAKKGFPQSKELFKERLREKFDRNETEHLNGTTHRWSDMMEGTTITLENLPDYMDSQMKSNYKEEKLYIIEDSDEEEKPDEEPKDDAE